MPNKLAGMCSFTINGVPYMVAADVEYSPTKVKRETLVGQDGVQGFSEMPCAPYIKATLRDAGNLTVADLNAMTDETIAVALANGKTVVGRNMWTVEAQEVKTQEGTFDVRFEGMDDSVTEITTQ